MLTTADLHAATLNLLAPITRDLYTQTGDATTRTTIHPTGIDLHDGDATTVAATTAGHVAPYMVLAVQPRIGQARRLAGGTSQALWGFRLITAAGSPAGVRWAIDKINTVTDRARLAPSTGLLEPYFDLIEVIEDPDASPSRWYAPLRWSTTVH